MNKPSGCEGCLWQSEGKQYVTDDTYQGRVFILAGHPSRSDLELGTIAGGSWGKDLDSSFISLGGLVRGDTCGVGSIVKCRPMAGKDIPLESIPCDVSTWCSRYLQVPQSTQLIVVLGKAAFNYAHSNTLKDPNGKPASFEDWRGFILPLEYTRARFGSIPVYVTHHPGTLHQNPGAEKLTEWDWIKVRSILDGTYPQPLPPCTVATSDTISQVIDWFTQAETARWIVCDTEFIPGTKYLTILGLLSRHSDGRVSGLQVDWRTCDPYIKQEVTRKLHGLVKRVPFIFHNCRADIPVLESALGIGWAAYASYEDTMLAHSVLWCELPHGLEFIASVWGRYPKLKHLKVNDELLYNFGDVLETDSIWHTIVEQSFKHDPQAEHVYRTQHLRLCPIVEKTVSRGLRVNKPRVSEARIEYEAKVVQAERLALACAGWPINLNSSRQLGWYLYNIRGLDAKTNKDTGNSTTDDSAIASLRMELGPPFDPEAELTYEHALERISQGADPILEARVLYAGAQTRLIKYIYPLYQAVAKATTDKQRDEAISKVRAGVETSILDRIHPDMLIHSQKTGRWSTVDPPIAQLPVDLRDIICPDVGEVWISWDWSAIEPRVLEALCGSRILKRSFDEGIDLHTWTVCIIFNYEFPPNLVDPHKSPECKEWREKYQWKGKDDPRRVFAKTGRYEMYYGGTGANAADAAALFGLDPKVLKRALGGLLAADPEYYVWRLQLEESLKRTRIVRTFMGRPRRFLKGGQKMIREGLDQPMQGAVSDIFNSTIVLVDEQYGQHVQFAWGMHDSQKWHCPEAMAEEMEGKLKAIAERTHVINGRATRFPIDIEVVYPPEREAA